MSKVKASKIVNCYLHLQLFFKTSWTTSKGEIVIEQKYNYGSIGLDGERW